MDRRSFLAGLAPLAGVATPAPVTGRALGAGRSPYGERSPFEKAERLVRQTPAPGTAASRTPLHEAVGCARRPNFDHPCRLNMDQGWKPVSNESGPG